MKDQDTINHLMLHYMRGRQDMDTRRTRKNGWNEVITAAMGKLPSNWPFLSVVTDPRIRTSVVEKTARLINAKLRGRLVPRNSGSIIKAKVQNALLDFQWDYANDGGSMVSKVGMCDQSCRYMGAGWGLTYWDNRKNSNEMKSIDPRDISFDGSANHIKNARWAQVREHTTWGKLEARGYNVRKLKKAIADQEVSDQWKSTNYESIVKANRGLMDRTGEPDDPNSPIVEVVTEWHPKSAEEPNGKCQIFLPRFSLLLTDKDNPYKHGRIPVAQLRYYPLFDDIYGETDVEYVLPIQRAINATLCGFIDEMTIAMRPPLKVASSGVRTETIEYGPGAQWVMDNPALVSEMQFSPQTIANFNVTYPALVNAFNTAMGDQSLGISNIPGKGFDAKTATEVKAVAAQQNNRDQMNQVYLSEFLEDVMMMWLSNNKQYLFDDPEKAYEIVKIVGNDEIKYFQSMGLSDMYIPNQVMDMGKQIMEQNPQTSQSGLLSAIQGSMVPTNAVQLNPQEEDPAKYKFAPKLESMGKGEANLYLTQDDFDGEYDYIPDVSSMASGANQAQQEARENALSLILSNPLATQLLAQQGQGIDIKDILVKKFEDAGYTDAEAMFKPLNELNVNSPQSMPMQGGVNGQPTGPVQGPNIPAGQPAVA